MINELFGLTARHVTQVAGGQLLHKNILFDVIAMQDAAKNDGFNLMVASGYRDFDRQKNIWNKKFSGERAILDGNNNIIDPEHLSDWEKIQAILLYSALPGLSRHHWGTDFDFCCGNQIANGYKLQLTSDEYEQNGIFSELNQWVNEHAATFGFFKPYSKFKGGTATEPWHLSHKFESLLYFEKLKRLAPQGLITVLQKKHVLGIPAISANIQHIIQQFALNINIEEV